jgi:phosphoenolpyruvate carboxykinase (ATP)
MATQTTPQNETSLQGTLAGQGLTPTGEVYWNLPAPALIQHAIRRGEGELADMGPFVAVTAPHTGRSPNDKFVVKEPSSEADVDWGKVNQPYSPEHFATLRADVQKYLDERDELFVQDLYCGADPKYRLAVRYVSPNAWHMAFVRNMFIRPELAELASFAPNFTVLHAPEFQADPARHGTRTTTFIVLNLAERTILIGGTRYAGELKKSMFTVMNYYMPKQGVLSMHCSANIGPAGDTALFFGLSGTGKTTLSADPARSLIGDDEHGWAPEGTFNYEGGCYAKVINLSAEGEPDIYRTTQMFGTILENVVLDPVTRKVKFEDQSITENTRASYPLHYIPKFVASGRGGHPKNIVFLTADAFGVLPPVAKLTRDQAMYYFLSGYTAKVAGTERGVTEPQATFSSCFGAVFLVWHPTKYAEMLGRLIDEHGSAVWLGQHRMERRPLWRGQAHEARLHARDGARGTRWLAGLGKDPHRPGLRPRHPAGDPRRPDGHPRSAQHLERRGRLRHAGQEARRDVPDELREVRQCGGDDTRCWAPRLTTENWLIGESVDR